MCLYGVNKDIKVADLMNNGSFNGPRIRGSSNIFQNVEKSRLNDSEDRVIWTTGKNGEFSNKVAWNATREKANPIRWYKLDWNKTLFPKVSFHMLASFKEILCILDKLKNSYAWRKRTSITFFSTVDSHSSPKKLSRQKSLLELSKKIGGLEGLENQVLESG